MKMILGKKLGMTRIFQKDGKFICVTIIETGPCFVTQLKNKEQDGYEAIQIGYKEKKLLNKPEAGHLSSKKNDKLKNLMHLKEIRIDSSETDKYKIGDEIKSDIFKAKDLIEVSGISKGKGFQGTVKRHHFHTGPKSHGSDNYRQPGSIGATFPQRTIKGRRMSGHMGHECVTIKKLEVVEVMADKNLMLVKGSVPGHKDTLLAIKGVNND